jgi:hypothetical protein
MKSPSYLNIDSSQLNIDSSQTRLFVRDGSEIKAWHFLYKGWKLRDGRVAPKNRVWLEHDGVPHLCASGLHASRELEDAMYYAPSMCLCRVLCCGEVVEGNDKLVCNRRKIIERRDITPLVVKFYKKTCLKLLQNLLGHKKLFPESIAHINKTRIIRKFIQGGSNLGAIDSHFMAVERKSTNECSFYCHIFIDHLRKLKRFLVRLNKARNNKIQGGLIMLKQEDLRDFIKQVSKKFKNK